MALSLISENEDASTELRKTATSSVAPGSDPAQAKENAIAVGLLLTALTALSKRALIALASLQVTLAIGSVLFLAYKVLLLPAPSITQVTGTAIYAGFVLLALWLSRR